jgi:hypothetical protein
MSKREFWEGNLQKEQKPCQGLIQRVSVCYIIISQGRKSGSMMGDESGNHPCDHDGGRGLTEGTRKRLISTHRQITSSFPVDGENIGR